MSGREVKTAGKQVNLHRSEDDRNKYNLDKVSSRYFYLDEYVDVDVDITEQRMMHLIGLIHAGFLVKEHKLSKAIDFIQSLKSKGLPLRVDHISLSGELPLVTTVGFLKILKKECTESKSNDYYALMRLLIAEGANIYKDKGQVLMKKQGEGMLNKEKPMSAYEVALAAAKKKPEILNFLTVEYQKHMDKRNVVGTKVSQHSFQANTHSLQNPEKLLTPTKLPSVSSSSTDANKAQDKSGIMAILCPRMPSLDKVKTFKEHFDWFDEPILPVNTELTDPHRPTSSSSLPLSASVLPRYQRTHSRRPSSFPQNKFLGQFAARDSERSHKHVKCYDAGEKATSIGFNLTNAVV